MRRGEIRYADLRPVVGHEQDGHRPVLIVSRDEYMQLRGLALVFPLTRNDRLKSPVAVELAAMDQRRSFALPGQFRAISTKRLGRLVRVASESEIDRCLDALMTFCGRMPVRKAENDG